ncbi:hypothetical protein FA15DRAFT_708733 [Coprinopsis marcescibilis]|uniref:Uncharacterized protein n=1 Tax=Coprinopsis marcescibilis TaxID=230819 RepID=A0A5C3KIR2_COPMA|nr:hypothetical protein FA15DRAFT_708733 [Coprinopsis marcescibilis]
MSQMDGPNHPHYSYLHTETSGDQDALDRLLRLIKARGDQCWSARTSDSDVSLLLIWPRSKPET